MLNVIVAIIFLLYMFPLAEIQTNQLWSKTYSFVLIKQIIHNSESFAFENAQWHSDYF